MRYPIRAAAAAFALSIVICSHVHTARQIPVQPLPHRDAVVLLGFHNGVTASQRAAIVSATGGITLKTIGAATTVLYVGQAREQAAINILKKYREVRYAEPDFIHTLSA